MTGAARSGTDALLGGKYRVLERIGAGGMGVVHAGVNELTEREVAIKRLLPDRIADPKILARFEREARAMGRIRSAHVVEIIDIARDEEGAPFLVMERLLGEPLSDRLRRDKRIEPREALAIVAEVLEGVGAAHRAGVIHRDLKPSNIFLEQTPDGQRCVKLVDFGISKILGDDLSELTRRDAPIGTFSYMPPEQVRSSSAIGPGADLWAAGVVLYRLVAGTTPFKADDAMALLAAIAEGAPAPLAEAGGLSAASIAAIEPIVLRALEKDPARRYGSAEAMLEDLRRAEHALAGDVPASLAAPSPPAASKPARADTAKPARADTAATRPARRSPWAMLALSAASCALGWWVTDVALAPRAKAAEVLVVRPDPAPDPSAATSVPPSTSVPPAATSVPAPETAAAASAAPPVAASAPPPVVHHSGRASPPARRPSTPSATSLAKPPPVIATAPY